MIRLSHQHLGYKPDGESHTLLRPQLMPRLKPTKKLNANFKNKTTTFNSCKNNVLHTYFHNLSLSQLNLE